MAGVSDDEVIKKRLLIDGDAGNDEKRLTNLLRAFIRWCNSDDNGDDSHITVQRMLATLAQSDHAIQKSALVYKMNQLEQENYDNLNRKIQTQIRNAEEQIENSKLDLKKAKQVRKHRQEYDTMAKEIQKQPDRQGTTKKLELVAEELSQLEETKTKLEHQLDLRRKQFHLLVSAIHELQTTLEEDEDVGLTETSKPEEMDAS